MECLEFRRVAGADPTHLGAEAERHRAQCEGCAAHHRQLLAMETTIRRALAIPVREYSDSSRRAAARASRRPARPRWFALAASVVAGVIVGSVLWIGQPRASLARETFEHMQHEPGSLVVTSAPADPASVERVLTANGFRLRGDPGLVSYAMSCGFRGHTVPHLVVQTPAGPVTVLVLRHERVTQAVQFAEPGFSGTITPFGPGSIAVIGTSPLAVAQVDERMRGAVEWID
jgi:hypothetical protein